MNSNQSLAIVRRSALAVLLGASCLFLGACATQSANTSMSIPSIAATDMGSNKSSEKPVTYAELHHMMDRLAAGPGLIGDQYWAGKAAALASDVNAGFVATNP
ncbi:MAG TPA: hypothetical protein VFE25_14585 [Opitutaceae bacterium]|jgi:hypothetical protein|nr:hypothetical protein [Opitutaceae bacterium]